MLIRSQNKQGIYNMDVISAIDFADSSNSLTHQIYVLINGREYLLGRYSTKEKAIAVLDMIEKKYLEPSYINDVGGGEYAKYERSVFQMPEDKSVQEIFVVNPLKLKEYDDAIKEYISLSEVE